MEKIKVCKEVNTYGKNGQNGWLMEINSVRDGFTDNIVGQVYMTVAYPGEVKGFHKHSKKQDHFTCVVGTDVSVLLYEDNRVVEYPMIQNGKRVTIKVPPGIPHAIVNNSKENAYIINYCYPAYDPDNVDQEEVMIL